MKNQGVMQGPWPVYEIFIFLQVHSTERGRNNALRVLVMLSTGCAIACRNTTFAGAAGRTGSVKRLFGLHSLYEISVVGRGSDNRDRSRQVIVPARPSVFRSSARCGDGKNNKGHWQVILIYTLAGIYLLVAAFAAAMTLREQSAAKDVTLADRILGALACCFWPVALAAVAVAVQQRRSPTAVRTD